LASSARRTSFEGNRAEIITTLKDYMQSGTFSRLGKQFQSEASIVLGGNIDTDLARGRPSLRYIHLFEPLPDELQDTAFLDRLHAYLPGWRMPKIAPTAYSNGYGFVSDYLAEVFHLLRRLNVGAVVEEMVYLDAGGDRSKNAVKKTCSGMLKLLFPGASETPPSRDDMQAILSVAIDGRQLILEQLATMQPGEYDQSNFNVRLR
jgi:ATP-dependent Lon protease